MNSLGRSLCPARLVFACSTCCCRGTDLNRDSVVQGDFVSFGLAWRVAVCGCLAYVAAELDLLCPVEV